MKKGIVNKIKNLKSMNNTLKHLEDMITEQNTDVDFEKMNKDMLDNFDLAGLNDLTLDDLKPETEKLKLNFVNESVNPDPVREHKDDSGFDLRANLETSINLKPLERKLVPTGIFLGIPENYEVQVRPRSGLAYKHGITVLNTPGTIDRGYTGEIKILLINLGSKDFKINNGDRIAQGVLSSVLNNNWVEMNKVDNLEKTERDVHGFGSTGTK